jgi:signal transduction histidine kinase
MEALEELRDRLRQVEDPITLLAGVFASAPVGLQIYEKGGRSLLVNQAYRDLFGTEPSPDYNVLKDEVAKRNGVLELIHRAFAGETLSLPPVWYERERKELQAEPGNRVAVAADFFPLLGGQGEVGHVAIVFRDVTAELRACEQAEGERDRNAQLYREAQDLHRVKDGFLAAVSHELRTPLQAILGWARILQEGAVAPEEARRGLSTIERNARLQANLIDQLLDASRIATGRIHLEWRPFDLLAVVRAVTETASSVAAAKRIELEAVLPEYPLPVGGDPERVQQVLWNVLGNALKFTPAGGRITVRASLEGDRARVEIADTGEGIEPRFLPHVFERFRQADSSTTRAHGGLGLGLALVRELVELQGGEVRAESPGRGLGSRFTIRLPVAPVTAGQDLARAAHPSPAGAPRLDGLTVLVVEDEPDTLDLVALVLARQGAEVLPARSVRAAMDVLSRRPPDVVVSDIGMAGEDGYDLLRRIRALGPERGAVPTIALTAYSHADDRHRALEAGFDVHLGKPLDPEELVSQVAQVARR